MNDYEKIKAQIKTRYLDSEETPDEKELNKLADQLCMLFNYTLHEQEKKKLVKELASSFDIKVPQATVISDYSNIPWLHAIKAETDFYYWRRYKWYLANMEEFPRNVITEIDDVTDNKILDYLVNPKQNGPWSKKGLVMGHVQSGKTANYTALINKAADTGYRLIILIAGIHNNLRKQTQIRINEGFIGRDGAKNYKIIGVGHYSDERFPGSLTGTAGDFKKDNLRALGIDPKDYKEPMILVIKKNKSTLENVIEWLEGTSNRPTLSYPMLMIDDEADNASINTSKDPERSTTINTLIRKTLGLFEKKCYVGYTATPFANIFIDPDSDSEMLGSELFPDNFIVSLDAPDNYFGAERIFSTDSKLDVLRDIDDYADLLPLKHKKDDDVEELPFSLYESIMTFILTIAIRRLRGQLHKHNSMLVNASRFKNIQHKIKLKIIEFMDVLSYRIRFNCQLLPEKALKDNYISDLYRVWQREYSCLEFTWEQIQPGLNSVVSEIKVFEINSSPSSDALDYDLYKEEGLNVITVGGFSLSRGFTLEGLSVSYFLRNSMMYDTLMQMGRWFGYRTGYEDLCRIYMTPEAQGWYAHISEAMEELRDEVKTMSMHRLTPREFGLKVRSHPDTLIVTAHNKMRSAQKILHEICYEGSLIETRRLLKKQRHLDANFQLYKNFVSTLKKEAKWNFVNERHFLWKNIDAKYILSFIEKFENHPSSMSTDRIPLTDYIKKGIDEELEKWDVVLIGKITQPNELVQITDDISIGSLSRTSIFTDDYIAVSGKKSRVGQASDEKLGLDPDALKKAEEKIKKEAKVSGNYYREFRTRPLLMLYLLNVTDKDKTVTYNQVVAYGISFPYFLNKSGAYREQRTTKYDVNKVWWKQHYGNELEDTDE